MKTITTTTNYLLFTELSETQQKQVLSKYWDYLLTDCWYYQQVDQIKDIIKDLFNDTPSNIYFSLDRANFLSFDIETSYKDIIELIYSEEIQTDYPDLYEYCKESIQEIENSYFYKNSSRFDIVLEYMYDTSIICSHGRDSMKIGYDDCIYSPEYKPKNVNKEISNLGTSIENFLNSLSDYFLNTLKDEQSYLLSDEALEAHFIEYDTYFNEETLEME